MDYLQHLHTESRKFRDAVLAAPADGQVPTCPEWSAQDLLWHLGEVQWFWAQIVERGLTDGAEVKALSAERPTEDGDLATFFDRASADLLRELTNHDPATPAWTWAREQTVGFIRRRQAHEALIHRLDAELTAGRRTPMDADLAADGVDEALHIMYGGLPAWGSFTPTRDTAIRLEATDTGNTWLVSLGTFRGTDPTDNTSFDEPDITVAETDDGSDAVAAVSGPAADLDCWLWHRPAEHPIARAGDLEVLARFDAVIAPGIN